MRQLVTVFFCLIVFGLCACSFSASPRPQAEQLILLPPADGPEAILLKQKVTFQSQDSEQKFVAVLRIQPDRLKLAALSATGQQLFFLEYDGEALIQKNTLSVDLPGEEILAVMQFALWPSSSIIQNYTEAKDWSLELSPQQRLLFSSSGLLLKVTYQQNAVIIVNYLHDYRLTVQKLVE